MGKDKNSSLIDKLTQIPGQVIGQTLDVAKSTASLTGIFSDNWLKSTLLKNLDPERLQAMAEAGHFLRDARETAGLSLNELAESLGLKDDTLLIDIENGVQVMPIELLLRSASLIARHDPIPFMIKFLRTYNPLFGSTLEQWGIMAVPKQFERERRWVNMYRKHDILRSLSDDEHERLINYVDSATNLVLDVMLKEKEAATATPAKSRVRGKGKSKAKAEPTTEKEPAIKDNSES
jgi:transcriptional regulator with XRE-family HTH domain